LFYCYEILQRNDCMVLWEISDLFGFRVRTTSGLLLFALVPFSGVS
jgi:hypothetical protein